MSSDVINLRDFYHRRLRLLGVDSLKASAIVAADIYREIAPLFESGVLTIEEPQQVPLEKAIDAYRRLEKGGAPAHSPAPSPSGRSPTGS